MSVRRLLIPLALFAAACSNELGPLPAPVQDRVAPATTDTTQIHVLRQSPSAPRLQTYRMSYWARRGTQTTVQVNYRPAPGQSQEWVALRLARGGATHSCASGSPSMG